MKYGQEVTVEMKALECNAMEDCDSRIMRKTTETNCQTAIFGLVHSISLSLWVYQHIYFDSTE